MTVSPNIKETFENFDRGSSKTACSFFVALLDSCSNISPISSFVEVIDVEKLRLTSQSSENKDGSVFDSLSFLKKVEEAANTENLPYIDANVVVKTLFSRYTAELDSALSEFKVSVNDLSTKLQANGGFKSPSNDAKANSNNEDPTDISDVVNSLAPRKKYLTKFGYNMCEKVMVGDTSPIIGMEEEVIKLQEILLRKKKSNAIILGDSGVGKSSLVELLAQKIVSNQCHSFLSGCSIYKIDIPAIFAGSKYRGEFEERMTNLLNEAAEDDRAVLFIDDIHMIGSLQGDENIMNMSGILKPYISDGKVKCIGATTHKDYRRTIDKDPALSRKFEHLTLNPPSKQDTLNILQSIKGYYESFHKVFFSNRILEQIVDLVDIHIKDRNFPDKAIDALDGLGAYVKRLRIKPPNKVIQIEKDFNRLKDVVTPENFNEIMMECASLLSRYEEAMQKWMESLSKKREKINDTDVINFFNQRYKIEVDVLNMLGKHKLLNLGDNLQKHLFGQEQAIQGVCQQLQIAELGLRDNTKPIASFMFCGSSGVGKSELAKQLSRYYFGNERILMFNMSEYQDKISSNKLIGSSPGYVGYEEGGRLINEIRNNPHCVVLFDEIEKAHGDVLDLFLQLLDEACIYDATGRRGDFNKAVIIFTTNIKPKVEKTKSIGFLGETEKENVDFEGPLKDKFKQEFLNRINDIVVFNDISKDVARRILDKELGILLERLGKNNIALLVPETIKDHILSNENVAQNGARNIRFSIEKKLMSPLTNYILNNPDDTSLEAYIDEANCVKIRVEKKMETASII